MKVMEYCWKKELKGQYVDGHECEDVIVYHQNPFLPFWDKLLLSLRAWDQDGNEVMNKVMGKRTILWTHDESTFYAHDWHKLQWVHDNKTLKPIQKGEGVSLMVADFVSVDYGWLCSPDGSCTAQVLFKAGKNCKGFFTNDNPSFLGYGYPPWSATKSALVRPKNAASFGPKQALDHWGPKESFE
jgi:hypothetical protein